MPKVAEALDAVRNCNSKLLRRIFPKLSERYHIDVIRSALSNDWEESLDIMAEEAPRLVTSEIISGLSSIADYDKDAIMSLYNYLPKEHRDVMIYDISRAEVTWVPCGRNYFNKDPVFRNHWYEKYNCHEYCQYDNPNICKGDYFIYPSKCEIVLETNTKEDNYKYMKRVSEHINPDEDYVGIFSEALHLYSESEVFAMLENIVKGFDKCGCITLYDDMMNLISLLSGYCDVLSQEYRILNLIRYLRMDNSECELLMRAIGHPDVTVAFIYYQLVVIGGPHINSTVRFEDRDIEIYVGCTSWNYGETIQEHIRRHFSKSYTRKKSARSMF